METYTITQYMARRLMSYCLEQSLSMTCSARLGTCATLIGYHATKTSLDHIVEDVCSSAIHLGRKGGDYLI